ncbi:MAG TPA: hypothetical protein VHB98_12625, partial [Chloroflexota bacterium]|nr:hypothetical protein [Chloroflexota bacterium]
MSRHVRHRARRFIRRGLAPLLVLLCLIQSQVATVGPFASVPVARAASAVITSVSFQGSIISPTVIVNGSGFGSLPTPTETNPSGYTG